MLSDKDKYTIDEIEEGKKYIITFKIKELENDEIKYKTQKVEINEKVFQVFNKSRLSIKKAENELYNKLDTYSDATDIEDNMTEIDNQTIKKVIGEKIRSAVQELPEIQKRRIIKYFFQDKTFEQIAKEENCTKRAVKFSVDIALKELYSKLKNEIQ